MTTGIFIVSTPLHLIFSRDACDFFSITHADLLIIIKRETDRKQIKAMLEKQFWNNIVWIDGSSWIKNRFIALYELYISIFLRLHLDNYNYGFFADYGRTILANKDIGKIIWLGDGSKIIYQHSKAFNLSYNRYKKQVFVQKITSSLFGLKLLPEQEVIIFSPYTMKYCNNIIENPMTWLSQLYRELKDKKSYSNDVFFLGGYFCETHNRLLMSENDYLDVVKKILSYYKKKNCRLIYVPNRHESDSKLAKIDSLDGLSVRYFDFPIEYGFVVERIFPFYVSSFFSSALFHFKKLNLSIDVKAFYIDFSCYCCDYKAEADAIYEALGLEIGFENIINLGEINA